MATIEQGRPPSSDRLLQEVARLDTPDLDTFLDQVLLLRAERRAPHLSREETVFLEKINSRWPPEEQARFNRLVSRRRANKITAEELTKLLRMTDQSEKQAAERVQAAAGLARLRGIAPDEMLRQLEI